jgi:galactose-6-phosphate isomerase
MSGIDVTDLILDPDVGGQTIVVFRRQQEINEYGEGVDATEPIATLAAVYPTGNNSLVREQAFQTMSDTITVVTKYPLNGPGKNAEGNNYDASIVGWEGNFYIVKSTNKFSKYGPGFVEAECEAIDYNPQVSTPDVE